MKLRWLTSARLALLIGFVLLAQLAPIFAAPGDLDTSFAGTGKARFGFGSGGDAIAGTALQSDGKIVVAGSSMNGAQFNFAAARYNSDGSRRGRDAGRWRG